MSSLRSDRQATIYALTPSAQASEKRADARKAVKRLKKTKGEEKASSKPAERALTLNELAEAKARLRVLREQLRRAQSWSKLGKRRQKS